MNSIWDVVKGRSESEVFTPEETARRLVNMFPPHVWSDPSSRILCLASKSGSIACLVFQRLMKELVVKFPNRDERANWILQNMLYVVCLDDSAADLVRKRLYGARSVEGNVRIIEREDILSALVDARGNSLKINALLANPPYQKGTKKCDGESNQANALYPDFWRVAKQLNPDHICMIMPSRWMGNSEAAGLPEFRKEMLSDGQIRELWDTGDGSYCFPNTSIEGGVCYIHWQRGTSGICKTTFRVDGKEYCAKRCLNDFDVFIRDPRAFSIVKKVISVPDLRLRGIGTGQIFGLNTTHPYESYPSENNVRMYTKKTTSGWVPLSDIKKCHALVDKWKVLTPNILGGKDDVPSFVLGKSFVVRPPSVCTHTYRILGAFSAEPEAKNFSEYVNTRFFRFLVSLRKAGASVNNGGFDFIPDLPMDRAWTDADLYERYGLTQEEQDFIEKMIKEMK